MLSADDLRTRIRERTLPPPEERKQRRLDAGLTLREVAEFCGTAASVVWFWEKGEGPSRQFAPVYHEALEIMLEAGLARD